MALAARRAEEARCSFRVLPLLPDCALAVDDELKTSAKKSRQRLYFRTFCFSYLGWHLLINARTCSMDSPETHLATDDIQEYCGGTASEDLTRRIEAHISDCADCAVKVAACVHAHAMRVRSELER